MIDESIVLNTFIEVEVTEENIPKVRETLRRMGILSNKRNELYQSCHLFKKAGNFYLIHFKEMYLLNNQPSTFNENDKGRRDKIASLLENWNLLKIVNKDILNEVMKEKIDVIPYKERHNYILSKKYEFNKYKSTYFKNE